MLTRTVQQDNPELAVEFMNTAAKLDEHNSGLRHPAEAVHFLSLMAGTGVNSTSQQPYYANKRFKYMGLYDIPERFRSSDEVDDLDMGEAENSHEMDHLDTNQMSLGDILRHANRLQGKNERFTWN